MPEAYNPPMRPTTQNRRPANSYAEAATLRNRVDQPNSQIDNDPELYRHLLLIQKQLEILNRKIENMDATIKAHEVRIQRLESCVKWDDNGEKEPELHTTTPPTSRETYIDDLDTTLTNLDPPRSMGWDDDQHSYNNSTDIKSQQESIRQEQTNINNTLNKIMAYVAPKYNATSSSSNSNQ